MITFREAATAWGAAPRSRTGRLESRSGAGVYPVTTADGTPAFVKITRGSRRELRFYLEVAPQVPVRTPRLLGHLDTGDGVALLLSAEGDDRPVEQWTAANWAALHTALAALHAMGVPTGPGWATPDPFAVLDLALIRGFWAPALPRLDEILSRLSDLRADMSAPPAAFIHGDCHAANIIINGSDLVFCDWQAAGVGRPSADYALLSVRATPAGVTTPPPPAHLDRAVLAEELALLVFQWPHYAGYNTPTGNDRIRSRAAALADRWLP